MINLQSERGGGDEILRVVRNVERAVTSADSSVERRNVADVEVHLVQLEVYELAHTYSGLAYLVSCLRDAGSALNVGEDVKGVASIRGAPSAYGFAAGHVLCEEGALQVNDYIREEDVVTVEYVEMMKLQRTSRVFPNPVGAVTTRTSAASSLELAAYRYFQMGRNRFMAMLNGVWSCGQRT